MFQCLLVLTLGFFIISKDVFKWSFGRFKTRWCLSIHTVPFYINKIDGNKTMLVMQVRRIRWREFNTGGNIKRGFIVSLQRSTPFLLQVFKRGFLLAVCLHFIAFPNHFHCIHHVVFALVGDESSTLALLICIFFFHAFIAFLIYKADFVCIGWEDGGEKEKANRTFRHLLSPDLAILSFSFNLSRRIQLDRLWIHPKGIERHFYILLYR